MLHSVILIKDPYREKRLFLSRSWFMIFLLFLALMAIFARMYHLQIINHELFSSKSTDNRVTVQPLPPTRGLIFDANNIILAENIPSYSLDIIREQVGSMDETIDRLQQLITITEEDLRRFEREKKAHTRRFEAISLRLKLTEEEVARVSVERHNLPGVEINSRLIRHYPMGELTAHNIGYVGRINAEELQNIDNSNYAATTHIGKIGVEKSHEEILHGHVGHQKVEVNARGRVLRILDKTPPVPGDNLQLHLDIELQQIASSAFGTEWGSLVAIDPNNGAIVAMISVPSFDNNLFVNGISATDYNQLLHARSRPMFNRALRGQYPPGSTTKPFVGLAGLEYQTISVDQDLYCPGYYQLENDDHRYRDWKKWGHGHTNLSKAIIESCDVYFYDLSLQLGIDKLHEFMSHFGFGNKTNLDIGGERSGLMPSRSWKRTTHKEPWYAGETLITGIGQGFMLATPIQLALATAGLANMGTIHQPQLVHKITDPVTNSSHLIEPLITQQMTNISLDKWQYIHEAMTDVVHSPKGTARKTGEGLNYLLAGKTGTAQVFSIAQDEEYNVEEIAKRLQDHALFIAFAPADSPQIAVAIIVENGGSGGANAAPIARKVISHYLTKHRYINETQ